MLCPFSRVRLFAVLWTVACQVSLSMGFSRQEYWTGLPCPPPGIFLTQGSNHCYPDNNKELMPSNCAAGEDA